MRSAPDLPPNTALKSPKQNLLTNKHGFNNTLKRLAFSIGLTALRALSFA